MQKRAESIAAESRMQQSRQLISQQENSSPLSDPRVSDIAKRNGNRLTQGQALANITFDTDFTLSLIEFHMPSSPQLGSSFHSPTTLPTSPSKDKNAGDRFIPSRMGNNWDVDYNVMVSFT